MSQVSLYLPELPVALPTHQTVFTDVRGYTWIVVLDFKIPGVVMSKRRPEAVARHIGGGVWRAFTHNHPGAEKYMLRTVVPAARLAKRVHRLKCIDDGPVRVDSDLVYPRPQRLLRRKDPMERQMHTVTPDQDNAIGMVYDGMTHAGIWHDDCQVCAGEPRKWYGAILDRGRRRGDETLEKPHAHVVVSIPMENR